MRDCPKYRDSKAEALFETAAIDGKIKAGYTVNKGFYKRGENKMRAGSSEGGELRHSRYLFWGLAAGYLMGVRAAAAVGAVFGAASMWKASAYYVEAGDAVFSPVVSGRPLHALLHLQIQFLMGMISLVMLVLIAVMLYQKNFSCLYYEAKRDGLTGLLSRQQFFLAGEQQLAAWKPGKEGTGKDADVEYGSDLQHRRDLGAGARRPAGAVPQRGPAAAGG